MKKKKKKEKEMLDLRCFPRVHKRKPFFLIPKCSKLLTRGGDRTQRKTLFYCSLKKKKKLTLCNTESTILAVFKCTAQQHHVSSPGCVAFQNFSIRKLETPGPLDAKAPPVAPGDHFRLSASVSFDNLGYFL